MTFCVPIVTKPRYFLTKTGISKNEEWLQIVGVPCKIINDTETTFILNSFTSSHDRFFEITVEEFNLDFEMISPDENGFLSINSYKLPLNVKEFENRILVKNLEKDIKTIGNNLSPILKQIITDKLFQVIQSQGSPYINIKDYHAYKKNEITLSTHKRFGCEIFNRNCRWVPGVSITYEEYVKTLSYPAPIGIREKDFCLPSELIETIKSLINQIANFENISDKDFKELKKLGFITKCSHVCSFCGEKINVNDYTSVYKSSDNFIEICHKDPKSNFIKENIYWGHGECNRRQGGYSEYDRIKDGLKLLLNSKKITSETYYELLKL